MRRLAIGLTVSLLLAACGGGGTTTTITRAAPATPTGQTGTTPAPTPTATPTTATSATVPAGAPVFFQGVVGDPKQRPSSLELTADGTLFVGGAQWSSWGGPTATGSGNAEYHGCTPNCAQAPTHTAFVTIQLSGVRTCSGRQYYSSLQLTLSSGNQLDEQFVNRSWSPC